MPALRTPRRVFRRGSVRQRAVTDAVLELLLVRVRQGLPLGREGRDGTTEELGDMPEGSGHGVYLREVSGRLISSCGTHAPTRSRSARVKVAAVIVVLIINSFVRSSFPDLLD